MNKKYKFKNKIKIGICERSLIRNHTPIKVDINFNYILNQSIDFLIRGN